MKLVSLFLCNHYFGLAIVAAPKAATGLREREERTKEGSG